MLQQRHAVWIKDFDFCGRCQVPQRCGDFRVSGTNHGGAGSGGICQRLQQNSGGILRAGGQGDAVIAFWKFDFLTHPNVRLRPRPCVECICGGFRGVNDNDYGCRLALRDHRQCHADEADAVRHSGEDHPGHAFRQRRCAHGRQPDRYWIPPATCFEPGDGHCFQLCQGQPARGFRMLRTEIPRGQRQVPPAFLKGAAQLQQIGSRPGCPADILRHRINGKKVTPMLQFELLQH